VAVVTCPCGALFDHQIIPPITMIKIAAGQLAIKSPNNTNKATQPIRYFIALPMMLDGLSSLPGATRQPPAWMESVS